jgi:hypothetical protein
LDWRPLRGVEQARLGEARLQARYAVQWLACTARAFVSPRADDGHTNMDWDDALDGFVTHLLKGDARLGLRITDLTLELLGGQLRSGKGAGGRSFPLHGRCDAHARQWLGEELDALNLDARAIDAPSPYAIPAHAIAKGAAYDTSGLHDALAEFAAWFANAHHSLDGLAQRMVARNFRCSPVRCWPHHFDIATLISFDAGLAEHARSVNAGLSPGDEHYDEPYFYVSPYPCPDAGALPPLRQPGHWHVHGFTAAIAPGSRILAATNPRAAAKTFLNDAVEAAMQALK